MGHIRTLVVAAMKEEIALVRPANNRVIPMVCGVGKVNAALALGCAIQDPRSLDPGCAHIEDDPRFSTQWNIILVGTAGAADPSLDIGDVVVATDTIFHDVDVTALKFAPGQIPYEESWRWKSYDQGRAVEVVRQLGHRAVEGTIASGDQFVSDPERVAWIYRTFGARCIDMETAAIAMACQKQALRIAGRGSIFCSWTAIRIISDRADRSAPVDFPTFLPRAAQVIADIVYALTHRIA